MADIFFVDNDKEFSYSDLLHSLNVSRNYCPMFRTNDTYSLFVNMLSALVRNLPLTLLDSDVNISEIPCLNDNQINTKEEICSNNYLKIDDIIDLVEQSSSQITIFTSGTTGQPKKVVHSVQTLSRSVRKGEKYQNQTWAFAYNPTHMAGLQVFFQVFINTGTLINVFNTPRTFFFKCVEKYQITHISATPTFYRLLLPAEFSCPSVIRITLGGEKSNRQLYDDISKFFPNAKINNVYASTEAGSLFAAKGECFVIPNKDRDKFMVVDKELLIHKSLLGQSDSFVFDGDFYHSGDIIEWVDESAGIFKFISRKNELINVGGYKVNPSEVEAVILSIEGVQQAFVYGKENSVLGNVLCADLKIEDGIILTELEIKKILKKQLQDFKIPRRIKFVKDISLTRTGKLKRV